MRPLVLLTLVLGLFAACADEPAPRDAMYDESHEVRHEAILRAAASTLPNAQRIQSPKPGSLHGDRSRTGNRINYMMTFVRAFDWKALPMDDARGGPMLHILAQAKLHERALAEVGFAPLRSRGGSRPERVNRTPVEGLSESQMPEIPPPISGKKFRGQVKLTVSHKCRNGAGFGGYTIDLDDPIIVHYRVYADANSGAVVFVRMEYDDRTTVLTVEFSYADRTVNGTDYGDEAWSSWETIETKK
jgi:hypothetical protein